MALMIVKGNNDEYINKKSDLLNIIDYEKQEIPTD